MKAEIRVDPHGYLKCSEHPSTAKDREDSYPGACDCIFEIIDLGQDSQLLAETTMMVPITREMWVEAWVEKTENYNHLIVDLSGGATEGPVGTDLGLFMPGDGRRAAFEMIMAELYATTGADPEAPVCTAKCEFNSHSFPAQLMLESSDHKVANVFCIATEGCCFACWKKINDMGDWTDPSLVPDISTNIPVGDFMERYRETMKGLSKAMNQMAQVRAPRIPPLAPGVNIGNINAQGSSYMPPPVAGTPRVNLAEQLKNYKQRHPQANPNASSLGIEIHTTTQGMQGHNPEISWSDESLAVETSETQSDLQAFISGMQFEAHSPGFKVSDHQAKIWKMVNQQVKKEMRNGD
jgi:hypothetical protein